MINLLLKIRYNFFKRFCTKKDFSDRKLVFEDKCTSLNNFEVKDLECYNDNPIWLVKEAVTIVPEGINIKCWKEKGIHNYGGIRRTNWVTGMIDTRSTFGHSNGLWVITAKVGEGWPALWLLKKDRIEPGYNRNQITPEIDIMEVIKGKFRHTIHYGYAETVYRRTSIGSSITKQDDEFHEYAVDILNNGYDFYIDGILTCRLRSKDPEFVSQYPNHLIINNAAHPYSTENTEMIVKSIKVYK